MHSRTLKSVFQRIPLWNRSHSDKAELASYGRHLLRDIGILEPGGDRDQRGGSANERGVSIGLTGI